MIVPVFCQEFLYSDKMREYPYLVEALAITVEKLRKERKLTKTALANFSDLQERYIRGIIKGERNPTVTAIYAICEALDLPPGRFFDKVSAEMESLGNGKCKSSK
jgi:transcriptional regulator with XRE-family HTH domain